MLACPPHESNEHGNPKSYVLKIKNLTIIRYDNQKHDEYPLKMKFLFPAPYEIDNDLYDPTPIPTIIHKSDLEQMHAIEREIKKHSQRRLSSTDLSIENIVNNTKTKPKKKRSINLKSKITTVTFIKNILNISTYIRHIGSSY